MVPAGLSDIGGLDRSLPPGWGALGASHSVPGVKAKQVPLCVSVDGTRAITSHEGCSCIPGTGLRLPSSQSPRQHCSGQQACGKGQEQRALGVPLLAPRTATPTLSRSVPLIPVSYVVLPFKSSYGEEVRR